MGMVVDYEARVSKIQTLDDLDKELQRAKKQMMRLRGQAKKASALDEKLRLNQLAKEAETVLRRLRMSCFDIEDRIMADALALPCEV